MKKKNKSVISQNQASKKQEEDIQSSIGSDPIKRDSTSIDIVPDISISSKLALSLLIGILLLTGFWVLKDFLLAKKTTLYSDIGSDMTNAFYPIYKMATDYFQQYGLLGWSFKQGMGQDISPFMNSPLYFLYYFFDGKNIPLFAGLIEFLRLIINGLSFYWFLKTIKYNNYTSILGGVCFSLIGFTALVFGWTPLLANSLLYTILVLISIEYILQGKNWYLLPIATMLIAIDQPFNFVLITEFSLIYLLIKLYSTNKINDWLNNGKLLLKVVVFGGLGIGMGFLIFYSQILLLLNSPRGSGDVAYTNTLSSQPILQVSDSIELFTSYLRWFSNDILGYAASFKGWQNYMEAPAFYVGLGTLLLLPQLFVFSNKRQKIAYGSAVGLVFVIITFSFFRYAFWAFTGNYYRVLAALIAVGTLLGGLKVIEAIIKGFKINVIVLVSTFIVLLIPLLYSFSTELAALINKPVRTSVIVFLLFHTIILAATRLNGLKNIMLWTFLGLTAIEMTYFDNLTINKREIQTVNDFKSKTGFNDYTTEAIDFVNKTDKSFFRIEKNYSSGSSMHASLNDPMVQNYNSTSSYHSFNHRNYISFMKGLELIAPNEETATRWVSGVRGRPLLMPLTSVKYYLVKGQLPFQRFGFDSLITFQDVQVFKNTFNLPIGFTLDKYITEDTFKQLSMVQKDVSVYRGFIIKKEDAAKFNAFSEVKDSLQNITVDSYAQLIKDCRVDTLQISSFDDKHFEGTIDLDRSKLLFLSIPFDKGWKAEVDGKITETTLVTFGMTGIILNKGKHIVKLYYEAPYLKTGTLVSSISFLIYGLLLGFSFWRNKRKNI